MFVRLRFFDRCTVGGAASADDRNFQFARQLVLFDLPADPELLEQRIGRLDRIGQTGVVRVWVPYVRGTAGEVMARWYHDALNAFERYARPPRGSPDGFSTR